MDINIKEYISKNWKDITIIVLVVSQAISFIFGWNGYSLVVGLKTGDGKAKLEFNDIEIDSSDVLNALDISSFKAKEPKFIAIHCTASREGKNLKKEDLLRIFYERGFYKPGYNYVVDIYGNIIDLMPLNSNNVLDYNEVCQGVKGHNSNTISICYVGGYDKNMNPKDTRTASQKVALTNLLIKLKKQFPGAEIKGHREFEGVHKECPVFNASSEYAWIK